NAMTWPNVATTRRTAMSAALIISALSGLRDHRLITHQLVEPLYRLCLRVQSQVRKHSKFSAYQVSVFHHVDLHRVGWSVLAMKKLWPRELEPHGFVIRQQRRDAIN